jgi:hypothetical protein
VLLAVTLGMRESHEDRQALGRDLIARGLGAPMLIVGDGAAGPIQAIEQRWPASDRQRCCVHRARNLYSKLPERERERVKHAYRQALDDAINANDAKQRLQASSTGTATRPHPSSPPTTSTRSSCTCATRPDTGAGGGQPTRSSASSARSKPDQGDRLLPQRGKLPDLGVRRHVWLQGQT